MSDPPSWLPKDALVPFFVATGIFSVGAGAGGYITSLHYEKIVYKLEQDNTLLKNQISDIQRRLAVLEQKEPRR